ncbi:mechanosensitive ion channel family protein [Chroococcus sp. FPU101]|uniref:mechanosensitive ion channel family protein n=1 Tax=Chroococcus sp. FPU101 TaxID=1974212 RepID=UPI001A8DE231|nr:mechanosensitive ion channel family protein [Chroococcus sp. FPU101]GFE70234.1 MscS Mechanosensitive ion channel [Chroococcus sp. FPU101]
MDQMVKKITLGLISLWIISTIAFWKIPASAQTFSLPSQPRFTLTQPSNRIFFTGDIEYASVYLDGYSLFQIASQDVAIAEAEPNGGLSPIQRRARRIERTLHSIVNTGFDPKTLEVKTATLNNLTVIIAYDQKQLSRKVILTVTEIDALIDSSSVPIVAERWSQIIDNALVQAWKARQPDARKSQLTTVVTIAIGVIVISCFLTWVHKLLKTRFNRLKKRAKEQLTKELKAISPSNQADHFFYEPLGVLSAFHKQANIQQQLILNILLQRLDQIGLILLWFGGVAAILYVFPETRLEGRGVIRIPLTIFIIWLILTLISNLASLYVNYKLREWVEQGSVVSGDPQRRILRAPTLLTVLRGIINFVSWCIGIIWFLAWKGFLPSSLLTGAGLVGAALTFVFQNLLKDWVNGLLIIFEDQYAVGDMIEFEGLIGIVEQMSLRATQFRSADGRLSTIPHNQITVAHNLSKDWSRVNFTIEVAYQTDSTVVIELMKKVAQEMAGDQQWQDDIIDPVSLIGVSRVAHTGIEIMMRITVKRLRQWDVEREFRRRLKLAFDEQGIAIGIPQQSLFFYGNPTQN